VWAASAGRGPNLRVRGVKGRRVPTRRDLAIFGGYVLAAAVYITVGVTTVDFLLSFWTALAYVLVAVWLVPLTVSKIL
jgi:hypothetical protein